jgi:hypothetical protein
MMVIYSSKETNGDWATESSYDASLTPFVKTSRRTAARIHHQSPNQRFTHVASVKQVIVTGER